MAAAGLAVPAPSACPAFRTWHRRVFLLIGGGAGCGWINAQMTMAIISPVIAIAATRTRKPTCPAMQAQASRISAAVSRMNAPANTVAAAAATRMNLAEIRGRGTVPDGLV